MDSNEIDSRMRGGFKGLFREIITGGYKKKVELPINLLKSDYQKNLEERGWKFMNNVDAENELMDYTESREKFRLLKKDCERFFPGKRIRLARAYNRYGERIPSERKIVAIYAQDRK